MLPSAPALCLGCCLMLNTNTFWRYLISVAQEIGSAPTCAHSCCVGEVQSTWTPELLSHWISRDVFLGVFGAYFIHTGRFVFLHLQWFRAVPTFIITLQSMEHSPGMLVVQVQFSVCFARVRVWIHIFLISEEPET